MKNKIKKIIPLILCFVLVAGSCLTVNASTNLDNIFNSSLLPCVIELTPENNSRTLNTYFTHVNNYNTDSEFIHNITFSYNGDKSVYILPALVKYSSSSMFVFYLFSSDLNSIENVDISYEYVFNFFHAGLNDDMTNTKTDSHVAELSSVKNSLRASYFPIDSHFLSSDSAISTTFKYAEFSNMSYDEFFKNIASVPNSNSDFIISGGKVLEYAQQPTAEIEPPQNLSIYRGYSHADQQYKFQMQWDEPSDPDLRVEVMYNVHWKYGTGSTIGLGEHHYKDIMSIRYEGNLLARVKKLQYLEDDLLTTLFQASDIEVPTYKNINKIYVRFAKEVDGVIQYSLWRKIDYMNIDVGNGFDSTEDDFNAESSTGSFDGGNNWIDQSVQNGEIVNGSEKEDAKAPGLDANGDNITDITTPIINPDSWDGQFDGVFDQFTGMIQGALGFLGDFPSLISEFFGFLPPAIITCLCIGLVMAILLRFLGR